MRFRFLVLFTLVLPTAYGPLYGQALRELDASAQVAAGACDGDPPIELGYQTRLAHRFAPIYWFAPDERYFPTLPLFPAFDGKDNNGGGGRDFADPQEILPYDDEGRPDWTLLDEWYTAARDEGWDRPAVFYRVRDLTRGEAKEIFRYLKSDEQAWKRLGERPDQDRVLRRVRSDSTHWMSVEYYVYYVNDWGLEGHPYDVEFVTVFLPCRVTDNSFELAGNFRVFVGPGHTDRVPSNVLLVNGGLAEREVTIWPTDAICPERGSSRAQAQRRTLAELGCEVGTTREEGFEEATSSGDGRRRPPTVLVELGDHSSAPDIDPFGLFDAGHDANWHINDLWGTRDVQATSALGFLGEYESWMTLPRTENNSVVIYPYFATRGRVLENLMSQSAPADAPGRVDLGRGMRAAETIDSVRTKKYALLSAEVWEELFDHAVAGDGELRAALAAAAAEIAAQELDGWNGFELPATLPAAGEERLRRWREPLEAPRGTPRPSNSHPWASPHYRKEPTRAFKTELFRPVLEGVATFPALVNFWYTLHGDRAASIQTGIVIPALAFMPVRFSGFAELRVGLYCSEQFLPCEGSDRQSFTASIVHTNHYNAGVTWYGKLNWVARKKRVDRNQDLSRWTLGLGVSLTPASLIASRRGPMGLVRTLLGWSRIQIGVGTDFTIAELELSIAPLDPVLRRMLRR